MMLRQYLPILIFMGLATVLGLALFTMGWILGPRRPDAEKLSPYECGFEAFEDAFRRALLPRRHHIHRVRPRNRILFSVGRIARDHGCIRFDRDADIRVG